MAFEIIKLTYLLIYTVLEQSAYQHHFTMFFPYHRRIARGCTGCTCSPRAKKKFWA